MAAILRKTPILTSFNPLPKPTSHHHRSNPNLQSFFRKALRTFFSHQIGDMGRLGFDGLGETNRVWISCGSARFRMRGVFGGRGDGNSCGGVDDGGDSGESNSSLLSWYLMALDEYPMATKAITSAFLTLIRDLICLFVIDQVKKLDLKQTFVFTFLGLVLVGPTLHFWYLSLNKLITMSGAPGAFLCLLLDQFVFSPIFIGVFLCSFVTLEGRPSQVVPKLQQVLAANVVALVWNLILSFTRKLSSNSEHSGPGQ